MKTMTFYVTCSRTINYGLEIEANSVNDAIEEVRNMTPEELEEHGDPGYLEDFAAENITMLVKMLAKNDGEY